METIMKRHIVRAGLASAAFVGLTGCGNKPVANVQSIPPTQPLAATQPTTKPSEPTLTTVDALTTKFANWTRDIEPLMSQHSRKTTAEPPDADFLDPRDFRLGPREADYTKKIEPPVQIIPIEHPVIVGTNSLPNHGTSIASAEKPGGSGANVHDVVADAPNNYKPAPAVRDTSLNGGDLESSLAKNLKEYPKDVWAQLDYQLLQFLKDKPTPQLDALSKLSAEDRELISAVMDSLTNFRNMLRSDSNMLMSRKVRALLDLAARVRAQADLIIPTLSLCTKVEGFGVYEPVEPARFTAMREHPIIVYCEVENFASHQNEKRMWETKLSQEVVLYTETGLPVWQDKTENIPDLARNLRHDFYVVKKTKFPPNIAIGRYLLKVTIVDQQASRVAEATIPVLFVAQ
jgi:hypothetical protein